jgi:hypothetical protein
LSDYNFVVIIRVVDKFVVIVSECVGVWKRGRIHSGVGVRFGYIGRNSYGARRAIN